MFEDQFAAVLKEYNDLRQHAENDELSGMGDVPISKFNTRAMALIYRVCTPDSIYAQQCKKIFDYGGFPGFIAGRIISVVDALNDDVKAGYLQSQSELIHGELFGDFLEMADHLLSEGFKDASAIITGSSLESHLRNLAIKNDVEVERTDQGIARRLSTNRITMDLHKDGIISKLDMKSILSWTDLRNAAAHGHYKKYEQEQVAILITGVRDFISRNPA